MIVTSATYNTINKWAAGISDTFALGLPAELTPSSIPIAVLPFVNASLVANRVFVRSVAELRDTSVTVLLDEGGFVPHPAGRARAVSKHSRGRLHSTPSNDDMNDQPIPHQLTPPPDDQLTKNSSPQADTLGE